MVVGLFKQDTATTNELVVTMNCAVFRTTTQRDRQQASPDLTDWVCGSCWEGRDLSESQRPVVYAVVHTTVGGGEGGWRCVCLESSS